MFSLMVSNIWRFLVGHIRFLEGFIIKNINLSRNESKEGLIFKIDLKLKIGLSDTVTILFM